MPNIRKNNGQNLTYEQVDLMGNLLTSPLLQSTIENDTNESPDIYLSPKTCPLCNFSVSKSPDTHLVLSYSILFRSFLQTRRAKERI